MGLSDKILGLPSAEDPNYLIPENSKMITWWSSIFCSAAEHAPLHFFQVAARCTTRVVLGGVSCKGSTCRRLPADLSSLSNMCDRTRSHLARAPEVLVQLFKFAALCTTSVHPENLLTHARYKPSTK